MLVRRWRKGNPYPLVVRLYSYYGKHYAAAAAAAAKSLQLCPTLCDPIDVSPPGSSIPGILQRFLKPLKIELLCDPAVLLLGIYLKETKSLCQRGIYTSMGTAALFTIARKRKPSRYPLTDD